MNKDIISLIVFGSIIWLCTLVSAYMNGYEYGYQYQEDKVRIIAEERSRAKQETIEILKELNELRKNNAISN